MENHQKPPLAVDAPVAAATWNTPEAIARHRGMSPEERLRLTIALSQAALRFATAPRERAR